MTRRRQHGPLSVGRRPRDAAPPPTLAALRTAAANSNAAGIRAAAAAGYGPARRRSAQTTAPTGDPDGTLADSGAACATLTSNGTGPGVGDGVTRSTGSPQHKPLPCPGRAAGYPTARWPPESSRASPSFAGHGRSAGPGRLSARSVGLASARRWAVGAMWATGTPDDTADPDQTAEEQRQPPAAADGRTRRTKGGRPASETANDARERRQNRRGNDAEAGNGAPTGVVSGSVITRDELAYGSSEALRSTAYLWCVLCAIPRNLSHTVRNAKNTQKNNTPKRTSSLQMKLMI